MARYTGSKCPVCKQPFREGDDVVVCPDCGTPYHRACWKKVGACLHQQEHAAGFEWKPEIVSPSSDPTAEIVCSNCGAHNPPDSQRCSHCGVPLQGAPGTSRSGTANQAPFYGQNPSANGSGPVYTRGPGARQPTREPHIETYAAGSDGAIYRREIGPDDTIDSIKARDWNCFLGKSSMYYLMQFFRMSQTHRKATFSFSAFLFGPAYFFYRKMWKQAALFTVLDAALSIPSVLSILQVSESPLLQNVGLSWLPGALEVCYLASWGLKIVMSLFAVYWYKQVASQRIQEICSAVPEGSGRADALALQGGTSTMAAVLFVAGYIAVGLAISFLLGPNLQAVLGIL